MKKALYAVLAVAVVLSAVVVGVRIRQRANEGSIEGATQAEVERQINVLKKQQPDVFKGKQGKMAEESYKKSIEDQVKINEMIKQEAKDRGVAVAPSEVDMALAQVRQAYASEKKFNSALKKQGLTIDDYKNNLEGQLVMSKMMTEVTKDIKTSNKEARTFYEANKGDFDKPYKEVVDLVKQRLLQQKQRAKFSEFIEDLKKKLN